MKVYIPEKIQEIIKNAGIRAKLSFFTAFFVIVIISLISILNLNLEYKSLSESYDREIQPLRKYTEKIVLDLENLTNTFLLIEDFRFRLKSKAKELRQYKKTVVQVEEKSWFTKNILGKLNIIKNDLVDTKATRKVSVFNTYYSEYITEKRIRDLEENLRLLMKDEKGVTISSLKFSKIQSNALRVGEQKRNIEQLESEFLDKLSTHFQKDDNGIPIKDLDLIKKNPEIEKELEPIKKRIDLAHSNLEVLKANLNSEILGFYYNTQKNNILELGIDTDLIRIQSLNSTSNMAGFDTKIYGDANFLNTQAIVSNPLIEKDRDERIRQLKLKELIKLTPSSREFSIGGKSYEILFRPIFRKPHIIWRAKTILETAASKSNWSQYLKEDAAISSEFKNLTDSLRKRIAELREIKTIKPSLDPSYTNLYKQYRALLKKRESIVKKYQSEKDLEIRYLATYKEKKEELNKKIETISNQILTMKSKLSSKAGEEKASLMETISRKEEELEDTKKEFATVSQKIMDWSHSESLIRIDAFNWFRDAAIYEYAILRIKSNPTDYTEYLESESNRELMHAKWNSVREWIMNANSETSINPINFHNKLLDTFEGGTLSRSRSEVEEEMWHMDSTPVFLETDFDVEQGIAADLFLKNISGFTRTIIDKSEGIEKIRYNLGQIIYKSSVLGISAIFLAFFFSSMIVKNIERISANAQLVGKGRLDVKFEVYSRDEIGMLSDTLNKMVYGLVERDKVKSALGKFVNPQIAEKVLKQELKLGGERKNCAILFSDIRGFTGISEKLNPEEVVEFLNEYMTEMVKCVNHTDGIVDKFIGDAVMATWGAAFSNGNDAENAVNAALMMRQALIQFNANRGTEKKPIIKIGCGINYGPVIAGQVGSEERLEYTVIGDAVNLASRVESLNKPMGTDILITEDLYQNVKTIFKTEKMQAIKVKGKSEPQIIYAVLGREDDPDCPLTLEEVRQRLGIQFDPNKVIDINAKEEKFQILPP